MRVDVLFLTAFSVFCAAIPQARAAFFVVDTNADIGDVAPGDGVCATSSGDCALRAAIDEANALDGADAVIVPAGTYEVAQLTVLDALVIGGAGAEETVIDGDGFDTVIVSENDLALLDLAVTGGNGINVGGGIRNDHGRLTVINCSIHDNYTTNVGAGIYNEAGVLTVVGSTIHANEAGNVGGGIHNQGSLRMIASTVDGNFAFNSGGGISNEKAASIENSTISGNWVVNSGAGILNEGSLKVTSSTITLNAAGNTGSGIGTCCTEIATQLTLENSILANNRLLTFDLSDPFNPQLVDAGPGADCESGDRPVSGSHNLVQNHGGLCLLGASSNLFGVDAEIGPLRDNGGPTPTHALLSTSPAIDAANPAPPGSGGGACPTEDQRGITRPFGAGCDIGAYELAPCGNGTLDSGEECDDSNGIDGDGCDSDCTNTACGNGITTDGEQCDDGNLTDGDCCSSACELTIDDDLLVAPSGGSKVLLREKASGLTKWKWEGGSGMTPDDFGDPTDSTTYTLCFVDESGATPSLVMTATAAAGGTCNGKPCWRRTGNGFNYKGDLDGPGRLGKVKLKVGSGKAKILVKGKGRRLRLGRLPALLPLRVVLRKSEGSGFGASFGGPQRNRLDQFVGSSD